jgi:hypothetical protein
MVMMYVVGREFEFTAIWISVVKMRLILAIWTKEASNVLIQVYDQKR